MTSDPRPTTTVTNDQGVTFHARLIRTGDRYGLADKLTNDRGPMVELFDAEADPAKFGPLGQFVSRYYVDTFNETAEDGRGIALDGAVPRWTITAANVAEVAAWLASLDTPAPIIGATVAPDKLNAVMEFDHVVTVNEDGTVSDGPAGVYAPDLLDHEVSDPTRWAPFGNYTSQQGGGWLMHNCESIGGQMARDILAEPGTYVAVVAYWSPDENDDHADEEGAIPEGWAVFRLIEPAPIGAVEIDSTEAGEPDAGDLIDDMLDSVKLAMTSAGIDGEMVADVVATVASYAERRYL